MAFIGMFFAGAALIILAVLFFAALLFLILGLSFKNKKQTLSKVFFVFSVLNFLPVAVVAFLILGPHSVSVDTPDGTVKISSGKADKLMDAIKQSDLKKVDKMLDKYPELTFYRDINGKTVLELGMFADNVEIMSCAVDHGAKFDNPIVFDNLVYFDNSFEYYFNNARKRNNGVFSCDTVKFMIDNGASLESAPYCAIPCICCDGSISDKDIELLELMIDSSAELNKKIQADINPYSRFCESADEYGVVKDNNYDKALQLLTPKV